MDLEYPEDKSTSDWLLPVIKGATGGVPVVGGLLGEILGFVWAPALQKRQAEWFKALGAKVEELSAQVADIESRLRRQEVLTVVANAARAATATHEETKHAALRNAVVSAAMDVEPDETLHLMFVSMVDRLTAAHLLLLKFLDDPRSWFSQRNIEPPSFGLTSSMGQVIGPAFPEWDKEFVAVLARDLDQMGLSRVPLNVTMSSSGAWSSQTTDLGKRFLKFISEYARKS